jgi:hypothetical protein
MSKESIPTALRELLSRLEYLSMTKVGYKLNIKSLTFADAHSKIDAVYRGWNGENKEDMVLQVNQIVDLTIEGFIQYKDTPFFSLLFDCLSRAKTGITTLMTTYEAHPDVVAQLRVCIANINLQLAGYESVEL